jgi:hypothetical protein
VRGYAGGVCVIGGRIATRRSSRRGAKPDRSSAKTFFIYFPIPFSEELLPHPFGDDAARPRASDARRGTDGDSLTLTHL